MLHASNSFTSCVIREEEISKYSAREQIICYTTHRSRTATFSIPLCSSLLESRVRTWWDLTFLCVWNWKDFPNDSIWSHITHLKYNANKESFGTQWSKKLFCTIINKWEMHSIFPPGRQQSQTFERKQMTQSKPNNPAFFLNTSGFRPRDCIWMLGLCGAMWMAHNSVMLSWGIRLASVSWARWFTDLINSYARLQEDEMFCNLNTHILLSKSSSVFG